MRAIVLVVRTREFVTRFLGNTIFFPPLNGKFTPQFVIFNLRICIISCDIACGLEVIRQLVEFQLDVRMLLRRHLKDLHVVRDVGELGGILERQRHLENREGREKNVHAGLI